MNVQNQQLSGQSLSLKASSFLQVTSRSGSLGPDFTLCPEKPETAAVSTHRPVASQILLTE